MGIIGFFKKITEKSEIPEIVEEKVIFSDLKPWVDNKVSENKSKEQEVFSIIKDKTLETIKDLNEKMNALENYDLEKRKDKDKVKLIVKENWKNYIYHVKKFILNLEELEEPTLEGFILKSNGIFSDFDKKSYENYQKATFLIGKEMAAVKESMLALSRFYKKVFDENKTLIDNSKALGFVNLKLKQIQEIEEIIDDINKKVIEIESELEKLNEKNKKHLQEIETIKQSKPYLENLEKKNKITLLKNELEKDLYELKQLIDFKALGNFFHINKQEMALIRDHKENFQKTFIEDNGASILKFLDESNLSNKQIKDKSEKIIDKLQEIDKIKESIVKDEIKDLLDKVDKKSIESQKLKEEREKHFKSKEKLKTKKQETKDSLKEKAKAMKVIFVD